jgi:hypothetical protein
VPTRLEGARHRRPAYEKGDERFGHSPEPDGIRSVRSPVPVGEWESVLATDPGATALQTPQYMAAVLMARGGRDVSRLYELSDGRRLVLPLVRQTSLPGLVVAGDYPGGFGHGSLLATGGLRRSDITTVVTDLRGRGMSIRIGGGHHTADQWSAGLIRGVVEIPRRVDVIDLTCGYQDYLARVVRRGTRQNVAKAARNGVEIECDTSGRLVGVFYDVYLSWVERWIPRSGLPPTLARHSALKQEPYAKFETVAALMGDKCRVFVAWHRGRAVASCINLVHGEHAIGWRSYSVKELADPVQANTATQVAGIRDAMESGCRWFDLGQSGDVSNLHSFKNSLGGAGRRVVDLRIEPPALTRARTVVERTKAGVIDLLSRSRRGT